MSGAPASRLEVELREQPAALARLLDREAAAALALGRRLAGGDVRLVVVAARGSSDNAARYAKYLIGAHNRLPVALATPSLYGLYRRPPRLDGALVIGISQSGVSPDVVGVLAEARAQGRPTVAVTNTPGSPLAAEADHLLAMHAGTERAVAATKSYVNSLGALVLLSAGLEGDPARFEALRRVPAALERALDDSSRSAGPAAARLLATAPACAVVARGFNHATAFEVALKVTELTGTLAVPFSGADLLHGPIGAIGQGFPVVLVAPTGASLPQLREVQAALRERGARILAIADDPEVLAGAAERLALPAGLPEWLSPLVAVAPGQVVAMELARLRGVDLDRPGGLSKVTTTR
ncbi:MAG TPA: SIS domain-containing protein [Actinomycetes bacterium]|jgi:glucosamine--fructose-6-phosphate aminotransferase (isomerizing)|nr:SIS domain-containing protein [Actinomycetes bacterium]